MLMLPQVLLEMGMGKVQRAFMSHLLGLWMVTWKDQLRQPPNSRYAPRDTCSF